MALDTANVLKARGHALQGGAVGFVLLVFSLLSVRIGRIDAALTFLPLIAIYLWPLNATSALSSILIFSLGLGVDVLSGGPVGLWAFVYLFLYGTFRPDLRGPDKSLYAAWISFLGLVGAGVALLIAIGFVFIPGRTGFVALAIQALVVIVAFPPVYLIHNSLQKFFSDEDSAEAGI